MEGEQKSACRIIVGRLMHQTLISAQTEKSSHPWRAYIISKIQQTRWSSTLML